METLEYQKNIPENKKTSKWNFTTFIKKIQNKYESSGLFALKMKFIDFFMKIISPFLYLLKNPYKLACWILFVFILGQGILFIDLIDVLLSGKSIESFIYENLKLGNMYSFSLACLGANLFTFNSDILKPKVNYKEYKLWINIIGICLMFFMIAGANSLSRNNEITEAQRLFQVWTYILSITLNIALLGIQLIEEEPPNKEDDKKVKESNDTVDILTIDGKGCKL